MLGVNFILIMQSKSGDSIATAWKEEWTKMYPDLKVEWRTVISRYNYHFGGIDEQENALKKRNSASSDFSREGSIDKSMVTSPDASNDAETHGNSQSSYGSIISSGMNDVEKDTNESTNIEELHESSLDDSNFRSNVKGFRNWTSRMQQELVETKNRLTQEHQNLIPGSTDFNHRLLREFQKLNPKCMESSRSIYSKLQSIEKTLNSPLSDNTAASKCWPAINPSTEGNTSNSDPAPMNNDCPTFNGESTPRLRDSPVNETQSDSTHCSSKNSITKKHEIPPNNTNNLDSNEDDKPNENSTIDGFQDWTLGMIRDFISCMDTARRRHAELRENQPNEQVKLVPLLLEEWRRMYPSSTESVKTFLVKIKHLKLQKDVIKKHLVGGGTTAISSTDSSDPNGLFKWNRDMIQDVIDSRRRALDIKDDALAQGKKLSFHALWASEFKKVYPNSTFTSNNLSVHFWTWRKQQLKKKRLSKKATAPSDTSKGHLVLGNGNSSNSLEQSKDAKVYNAPGPWSKLYKKQLLEVGRRVEQMLQGKDTPNEVKLEGFANILHAEWKKVQKATNGTKQDVSARAINMMYSRLLREKDPSLYSNEASVEAPIKHLTTNNNDDVLDDVDSRITATWTPKHNRVLRECMEGKLNDGIDPNPISNAVLTDRIIKQWRKKFPKSSISDDNLSRRITDSMFNQEAVHVSSSSGKVQKHVDTNDTKEYLTIKEEKPFLSSSSSGNLGLIDSDTKRLPNRTGQIIWNKESIVDLFKTHHETKNDMNNGTIVTKNDSRHMAFSLHKSFVKLYPHCRLSAVMLLAKYYKLKSEIASGSLDINIPNFEDSKIKTEAIKSEAISDPASNMEILLDCNTNNVRTVLNKETGMRDLVFRTWTQEMIDDMLKTRSIAIAKKKTRSQKDPCDPITITDLWYDEFLKCHPNYKSTKKNLWRKYKWYMSRISAISDKHFGVNNASSGKDTSLHENKLMGNNNKASKITKDELDEESAARLKPVRKDVFHFIKAVLEESRIFLPMKLPEEPLMKKYQEKPGKDSSIHTGGKTLPCDSGMAMLLETAGTEHHAADNYTTISALVKTDEVQPDFPSSLNVPNLSCLNTNDGRPSSRASSKVTLQQMFAPSQPLITSVSKLPASVTVTPRHSDTTTTEEHGNKGGKNTSESKRSSIKLPGKLSLPLLDNTISTTN